MFNKVFFAVLLATALIQSESAYSPFEYQLGDNNDVTNSTNEALGKLKNAEDDLKNHGNGIIQEFTSKIQEEFKTLGEQLKQITEDARTAGTNITDCVKDRKANFIKLPFTYIGKMVGCVKDKIYEGKEIIKNTTESVKGNLEEMNKIKSELKECGSGIKAVSCIARVMTKMAEQAVNIPIQISTETTKAIKLIVTLKPAMMLCAKENVLQMKIAGQEIIEDIAKCVSEKNK